MRIGIISDIHSNVEALTQSLAALERHRPDRVFCLGDVVGYGASGNECCDLVRKVAEVTLLGNHDAAVSGRMDYSFYYDAARHALDWTASRIDPGHLEWLRSLPYRHQVEGVQFSLDRLRSLRTEEIKGRYAEARKLAHFDDLELDLFDAATLS